MLLHLFIYLFILPYCNVTIVAIIKHYLTYIRCFCGTDNTILFIHKEIKRNINSSQKEKTLKKNNNKIISKEEGFSLRIGHERNTLELNFSTSLIIHEDKTNTLLKKSF